LGPSLRKEKKLLAVDGEVAQKIIQIANRKGMTVYSFTNEILKQAIVAENMNKSLEEIVERFRLLEISRNGGTLIVPADALLCMIERVYQQEKDILLKRWYESGRWYGKYLQVKFYGEEPLDIMEKLLDACSSKSSEIRILRDGDKLFVNWLSPNDSLEYTELFSKFLEGLIHAFGYETKKNDVSKGLIAMEFEKSCAEKIAQKSSERKDKFS